MCILTQLNSKLVSFLTNLHNSADFVSADGLGQYITFPIIYQYHYGDLGPTLVVIIRVDEMSQKTSTYFFFSSKSKFNNTFDIVFLNILVSQLSRQWLSFIDTSMTL